MIFKLVSIVIAEIQIVDGEGVETGQSGSLQRIVMLRKKSIVGVLEMHAKTAVSIPHFSRTAIPANCFPRGIFNRFWI